MLVLIPVEQFHYKLMLQCDLAAPAAQRTMAEDGTEEDTCRTMPEWALTPQLISSF